jgi:hypothetical protein
VPVVIGVAALFLLLVGLKVHHDYAALAACHGAGAAACERRASALTSTDWTMADTVLILMNLAPVLIGTFAGIAILQRLPAVPHFWSAQFIEAGWLLALSVLLVAGTLWLVRHRVG